MLYINHDKKAIFIHIPKTGGSYIGPELVNHYGFKCYLNVMHNRRPDHDTICQTNKFISYLTNIHKYDFSFFNKLIGNLLYCKTSEYINNECNMDDYKWKTYTKFCFIRHPYDRAISGWTHIKTILGNKLSFEEYLLQNKYNVSDIEYAHIFMSQKTQIEDIDSSCGIDIIGRFENLETDFRTILGILGFDKILHTPKKINSSKKNETNTITLSVNSIKQLNIIFKDDLSLFHYKHIKVPL